MKYSILLFFIMLSLHVFSQDTLEVVEKEALMSQGKENSFFIMIPQAKMKDVSNNWKRHLKKNKGSVSDKNGEYVLASSVMPDISSDSVIIYTTISQEPGKVFMNVFLSDKDSNFISSKTSAELTEKMKTFVRNFAVNEYRNAVTDELQAEQKKLKLLEEELQDLGKDNDQSEKRINSNKRSIERKEDELKVNLQEQELKSSAIFDQKQLVGTHLDDSELKDAEEKKLRDLEKDKKKLQKQNESIHKDIEELESENKNLKKKIDLNESDHMPAKKGEIEKQKKQVEDVDLKMRNIR